MLKPIRKKRAYEDIVEQIRLLIQKRKLKRGDQIPNERELSLTFKVSRATVREALLSLETMNLLGRRQGDGTYVIASSEETLVQPLAAALFQEKGDLIDIFSLRRVLEPEVAQLASENGTPDEIIHLEKILEEQIMEIATNGDPIHTDIEFHHLIARMARNGVLERLLLAFGLIAGRTRGKYLQTEERKLKSVDGHKDILIAIKNRDGTEARKAMRQHLERVESIVLKKRKGHGKEV
jgi:GntR family transcriptional regulator, transcriptional repressor for pyruvate dehydrogenase complex